MHPSIVELVVPATRNSKNRKAGTLETKSVNVNRYVYKDLMFNKVLPDINNKWRGDRNQASIILQHGGASGHKMVEEMILREAMDKYGLDIQLKKQPPQSPDIHVFDCGIFCSMQRMVILLKVLKTLDELINVVDVVGNVWKDYPHHLINDVFLFVQCSMRN